MPRPAIHCREHGTSGLGVAFPLRPDDPIDLDTGDFAVAPHSTARMRVTMSPGPIVAGSITAQMDCFDNEPITSLRTTTVTRTLQGEGCAGPGAPYPPRRAHHDLALALQLLALLEQRVAPLDQILLGLERRRIGGRAGLAAVLAGREREDEPQRCADPAIRRRSDCTTAPRPERRFWS